MSFRFEFDRNKRILRGCLEGCVGDIEIANFREEIVSIATAGRPIGIIVNMSQTERYEISNANILSMAKSDPALPGVSIPIVIVAPSPHMFGASRVFQITSEEKRPWLHVVKSTEEAYEILKMKSAAFEPLPSDRQERKKIWDAFQRD